IERLSKLSAPADRFDLESERIEACVGANLDSRPFRMFGRCDLARARQPAGEINPTIRSERRMADAQLRRAIRAETRKQNTALVGSAVAVSVFQKNHVRGARNNESAVPGR